MKLFVTVLMGLMCSQAMAYRSGTYVCKGTDDILPANVYKVSEIALANGVSVPYLEITRHYHENPRDPQSPAKASVFKGMATAGRLDGKEYLTLGAITLEFENNQLVGCR